ncbi:MAG: diacylglycerol kinase family protein [Patescibacteria group bacterium]
MFSLKRLKNSFFDAFAGIRHVFLHEQNFRIQIFFGILAILLMFIFDIKTWEKMIVFMMVILVLVLELTNTVVETFINLLKPRMEIHAGIIKDIMAGVVFIASCGAAILGIIIFYPYFISLFGKL